MKEEKTVFYPYSSWLKQRYGEKVYKLPVNLPVSCPNRCDGHGGCTFCSEKGTGFESVWQPASVTEQMQHARDVVAKRYKARKFIAYFQNLRIHLWQWNYLKLIWRKRRLFRMWLRFRFPQDLTVSVQIIWRVWQNFRSAPTLASI